MINDNFFAFVGIDKSGKSTQVRRFHEFLLNEGYDTMAFRSPGGTVLGEHLRTTHFDQSIPRSGYAEAFLFAASFAQAIDEIILPALQNERRVIADRWINCTIAHQPAFHPAVSEASLIMGIKPMIDMLIQPRITFWIDTPVEVYRERAKIDPKRDSFDDKALPMAAAIRDSYYRQWKSQRASFTPDFKFTEMDVEKGPYWLTIQRIDGNQSENQIAAQIQKIYRLVTNT